MKRQKILLKGILIGIISIIFVLLISFRVDARKLPRRNLSVSYNGNSIEYTEIDNSSGNNKDITRIYEIGDAAESGVRFIKGFTYDTADELQYKVLPDLSWNEIYDNFIYDALLEYMGTEPDLQNASSMSLQLKYWKGGILDYTTAAYSMKYGLTNDATSATYMVGLVNDEYVVDLSALTTEANFESSMYSFAATTEDTVVAETMIINIQFSNATNASTEKYTFEFTLNSLNFKAPNDGEFIRIMNDYNIGSEENEENGSFLYLETDYEDAFSSYGVTYYISSDGGTTYTLLSDLYDMSNEPLEVNTYVAKVVIDNGNNTFEYLSNTVTTNPYTLKVLADGNEFTRLEQGIENVFTISVDDVTELDSNYMMARFTDDPEFDTNQQGWLIPANYTHSNLGTASIYISANITFDEYTTIYINDYSYEYEVIPHYPDPVTPTNINSVSVEQNNDVTVNKYIDSFLPLHVGVKPTLAMSNIVSNYLSPKINELGLANVGFNNYNLTIKYSVNGTTEYEETILMYKGYELVSNGETTSYQETIGVINETTGYLTPFESIMHNYSYVLDDLDQQYTVITEITLQAVFETGDAIDLEFTLPELKFVAYEQGEIIKLNADYIINSELYLELTSDYENELLPLDAAAELLKDSVTIDDSQIGLFNTTVDHTSSGLYQARLSFYDDNSQVVLLSNELDFEPLTLSLLADGDALTEVEKGKEYEFDVVLDSYESLEFETLTGLFEYVPQGTVADGHDLPYSYTYSSVGEETISVSGSIIVDDYLTVSFNDYSLVVNVVYPYPITPTKVNTVEVEDSEDVSVYKFISSYSPLKVGFKPYVYCYGIIDTNLQPQIETFGLENEELNNYNLKIIYNVNGNQVQEHSIALYMDEESVLGFINPDDGIFISIDDVIEEYSYIIENLNQEYVVDTYIAFEAVYKNGESIEIVFDVDQLKFVAYEQGEIIKLSGQYTINSILNLSVTSDYFEALTDYSPTVLLSSNNEKLASFDYLFTNQSYVEEAALYQVSLEFSIDNNQYEYLSNELDFEPMDVTLLVNNQELTSVSPNKEYIYSVALNGEKNLSFTTLEGLFENSNIVNLPGSYTYTDLGRDTIHIDGQLEYNDFLEVDFADESFEIIIEFNYPDDVIVRSLSEKRIDLSSKESSEIYMSKVLLNMDPLFLAARPNFNWDLLYENYLVAVINEFGKNPDNINNYELEIAYWLNGTYSKDVYETLYYGPTINDEYTVGIKDGNYIIPLNELEDKDFFTISSIYQSNEVKTELTLTIKFTDNSAINVIFDLNILKFIPVDQGEIISLMQYVHTGEPYQDVTNSSVSLNISSDYYEQLQEYNPIYGLQVNDSAYQILSSEYDILVDESQVSNYRAKVILEGHDGFVEFTSNIVRVQPLQIQLLMNGKALSDIEVNKEYTFTLSINGKEYSEFEYSYLYLNETDEPIELPYTKTYTETGRQNIVVACELSVDDFTHYSIFEQHFEFNVQSVEKEAIVITHKYEITMDILNGSVMVVDGSKVRINVKYLMDGKEAIGNLIFGVNGSALAVTETGQGYFDILAVSSGEGIAYAICETLTGETIQKSVKIKVVQATNDNVELVYKDDFNKTGTTIVGTIVIDGEKDFLNFNPRFTVQRSKDDVTEDFAFSTNKNVIEIPNTLNGKYNIKAYSPSGDLLVESTKKVAAINLDLLTRQILPFVAIVLVVVLIIFIAYILRVNRRAVIEKTLEKAMSKGNALLDKDINLNQVKKYLIYLQRVLSSLSDLTNEYDNESIGQYQSLLTLINEGLRIVDNVVKKFNILDEIAARSLIKYLLDKYLQPAHDHAKTLTEDAIKFKYERAASAVVTIDDKDIPHRPEDELGKIRDYYGIPNTFMEGSTDEANVDSDSDS